MFTRWFHRAILSRRWLTFIVMGLAFLGFGAGTVNLLMLFGANATFIASYGWEALMEGGARQFIELVVTGYLSMAAYVIFKTCEHHLVNHLSHPPPPRKVNRPDSSSQT